MSLSLAEQMLGKIKVKVFKKNPDDRVSLCGEPVNRDDEGKEFFIIPGHQADYIKATMPHYEVGGEFMADADVKTVEAASEDMEDMETEAERPLKGRGRKTA